MWIRYKLSHQWLLLSVRSLHHGVPLRQKLISDTETFKNFIKENAPSTYESQVLEDWKSLKKRKATPEQKKHVSMLLPPPNITGHLHLGHVLTVSIQDVLARWYDMQGYDVVWLPGTDHAGIATQVVVEKSLQKQGISRYDLGREAFKAKIEEWKADKGCHITDQLRKMGLTLDWSREYFTMDSHQAYAVRHAVIQLFENGLLYRDNALVNWCCALKSTISDIEVDHIHITEKTKLKVPGYENPVTFGQLYNFAYKVCDSNEEIVVSTTRPETIPGDVALAVHPEDSRYCHLHNAMVQHPLNQTKLPIVLDESVQVDFGTGAMKITPAHDRTDFEISKRHNLPLLAVFNDEGRLSQVCSNFEGLKRFDAREEIIKDLEQKSLLRNVTDHEMSIPVCSRTGDVIELMLKPQWFINCKDMGQRALESLQSGHVCIDPSNHVPAWNKWFENTQAWCVSRQLWWGHQLPLYQCERGWVAAHDIEEAKVKANAQWGNVTTLQQDDDVLDTWFSSALLPFSSLGWPHTSEDFLKYYPLSFMETGHDILCFWVARMVMLGIYFTGQAPFPKVILHGMVCDGQNRKMSKSLGNTIEPEYVVKGISLKELNKISKESLDSGILSPEEYERSIKTQKSLYPQGIPECGTDALRFTLIQQPVKSVTVHFDVNACLLNKRFGNKILNLAKFTCCNAELLDIASVLSPDELIALSVSEKWILSRLANTIETVNYSLASCDTHIAARSLKQFLYGDLCDIFVELAKPMLNSQDEHTRLSAGNTLVSCLEASMRLVSPFMPFLTHVLYKYLPGMNQQVVSHCSYPLDKEWSHWKNNELEHEMSLVLEVVSAIRRITSGNNISGKVADVIISSEDHTTLTQYSSLLSTLVRVKSILILDPCDKSKQETQAFSFSDTVNQNTSVHIILNNSEKNITQHEKLLKEKRGRLKKEIDKLTKKTEKEKNLTTREGFRNKLNSLNAELSQLETFLQMAKDASKVRHSETLTKNQNMIS